MKKNTEKDRRDKYGRREPGEEGRREETERMITKREEGMRYADKQEGEEQITRREIKEDEQKTRKKKRKEEGKKSKQPGRKARR